MSINEVAIDPENFLWNADSWLEIALSNEDHTDPQRYAHGYRSAIMLNTLASAFVRYGKWATIRDKEIWEKHAKDSKAILERYEEMLGPKFSAAIKNKTAIFVTPPPLPPNGKVPNYAEKVQNFVKPRRYKKFTTAQEDEIAVGYQSLTVNELAQMYDCSPNAIRRVLDEKKIQMRKPGERVLK